MRYSYDDLPKAGAVLQVIKAPGYDFHEFHGLECRVIGFVTDANGPAKKSTPIIRRSRDGAIKTIHPELLHKKRVRTEDTALLNAVLVNEVVEEVLRRLGDNNDANS